MRTAPGVDRWIAQGEPTPPFDRHAPLLSLPTEPVRDAAGDHPGRGSLPAAAEPELVGRPGANGWGSVPGPKVGIIWRGNAGNSLNARHAQFPHRSGHGVLRRPRPELVQLCWPMRRRRSRRRCRAASSRTSGRAPGGRRRPRSFPGLDLVGDGRHGDRPPRGRARQAHVDIAGVRRRLALAHPAHPATAPGTLPPGFSASRRPAIGAAMAFQRTARTGGARLSLAGRERRLRYFAVGSGSGRGHGRAGGRKVRAAGLAFMNS